MADSAHQWIGRVPTGVPTLFANAGGIGRSRHIYTGVADADALV